MSKFVCNVQKFKGGQLYGMDIHIQRKTENHSNKDIDVSRSNLNYELVNGQQNQHYFTAVKKRIEQGYTGKKELRKDATLACGVLISSDKQFFEKLTAEQERQFFQTAYEHLCETYGKENIISAKVHKDETTPHLHAIVVPLTKDGRLTAKELFDRKALTALHNNIPKKLKERGFNIERGEKNANVKRMETDEWKRIQKQNQVTVKINPDDTVPRVLEKTLLNKIVETPEQVAERLNAKYIEPLTAELSDLKTDIAVQKVADERKQFAKSMAKSSEDDFAKLYFKVKSFGTNHVQNVLEKCVQMIEKMNTEKQQKDSLAEQEKQAQQAQKEQAKQADLYGGKDNLYQVMDFDKAPHNFEDNGKESFYVVLRSIANNQTIVKWGDKIKDTVEKLALRMGDFVRLKGEELEKAQRIEEPKQKTGGMKL